MATYQGSPDGDVYAGTSGNDVIDGNGGRDSLAGGGGSDVIDGGDADDDLYSRDVSPVYQHGNVVVTPVAPVLDTGTEVDTLRGGAGYDRIFAGYGDNVDGGADGAVLFISFQGATSGVTADFRTLDTGGSLVIGGGTITNITNVEWVDGSNFNDTLTGGAYEFATHGSPDLFGLGGNDVLVAGLLYSNLYGGDGDDVLDGRQSQGGYYSGGVGNDTFYTGGSAYADGGEGSDTFIGAGTLHGGAGNDIFNLATTFDNSANAYGEDGNDILNGSDSAESLIGGAGADVINGGGGNDRLWSGGGKNIYGELDLVDRGTEHDQLSGGAGDDTLSIGIGDDADGGTGTNTLILSLIGASAGVTFDGRSLATGSVTLAGGTISNIQNIEHIYGSAFTDTIIVPTLSSTVIVDGDAGNDHLTGSGSAVTFFGGDGDDVLTGGSAGDYLIGGAGADVILAGGGDDNIAFGVEEIAPGETIDGGDGFDTITIYNFVSEPFDLGSISLSNVERVQGSAIKGSVALLAQFQSLDTSSITLTTGGSLSLAGKTFAHQPVIVGANAATTIDMTGVILGDPYHGLSFTGGSGSDTVTGTDASDTINAGGGDDTINGGNGDDVINGGGGNDTINGGDGNDVINGEAGSDVIHAGAGDDIILVSGGYAPNEIYDGGDGFDTLGLQDGADISGATLISIERIQFAGFGPVSMTAAQLQNIGEILWPFSPPVSATITLTTGGTIAYSGVGEAQTFNLANAATTFDFSGATNPIHITVNGASGNDVITGGAGADTILGGAGNDTLDGGDGGDLLRGDDGDDVIHANPGDIVEGGNGFDLLDFKRPLTAAVLADFTSGIVTIEGGQIREIEGLAGPLTLSANDDNLILGFTDPTHGAMVDGAAGNDTIVGTAAADMLSGGTGDDVLEGGKGADHIDGGGGNDTTSYAHSLSGVSVNLSAGAASGGDAAGDQLISIENVIGSAFDDILVGTAGANRLDGGAGNDFVDYAGSSAGVAINLKTGTGSGGDAQGDVLLNIERVRGSAFADTLTASDTASILEGGAGADALIGGAGSDMADYSASSAGVTVNLKTGTGSGGDAQGDTLTSIERVQGSAFADTLTAGDSGSPLSGSTLNGGAGEDVLISGFGGDTLTGGTGADMFVGTAANLNNDTIVDFGFGDSIVLTNATSVNFQYFYLGNRGTLSYVASGTSGGTTNGLFYLTAPVSAGSRLDVSAAGNGLAFKLVPSTPVQNDFNGDGRSDILWRSDAGQMSDWLGQANGGFVGNDANAFTSIPTSWKIVGTGDFNGDGRSDILWRNDNGQMSDWLGQANGGFVGNDANAFTSVPTNWHIVGTGDFNGDGRSDILWRNDGGQMSNWLGQANGGFVGNDANAFTNIPTSWKIAGTGDFNGDGRSDILWRNDNGQMSDWLGQANGGFAGNDANAFTSVPTNWKIIGTGDFNGDGRADILWRNDGGQMSNWLGQASGGFVGNDANAFTSVPTSWKVVETGDYNGDGRDDILWRNDNGQMSNWLGQANGGFVGNDANAFTSVPMNWQTQPVHDLIV